MHHDTRPHLLLLTGRPGIGKTTLLRRVAAQLQARQIRGFYTQELREGGERVGFRLVTFDGDEGVIAHVDFTHRHRIGKYGVDVEAIDRFADTALAPEKEAEIYLIDEIGKMECLSRQFVRRVETLLASDKIVIATVAQKGGGLIETAKQWPGRQLWEVTDANRDALVTQVTAWLEQRR